MLGFYNYTVILTYIGMLTSFFGIVFAADGSIMQALLCLMISGFCDMFDGRVASTMKRTRREKNFGIQIDSLSDLVCFGVLPAVIVHMLSPKNMIVSSICGLYLLCALIRLAYFNVDEAERQESTDTGREIYQGLPVTSVALILPLLFCASRIPGFPLKAVAPVILLLMATAFVTPFHLKKPALPGKLVMSFVGISELALLLTKGGF